MIARNLKTRFGALAVTAGLVFGGSTIAVATLGGSASAASHATATPFAAPLPPGAIVTCTQISGSINLRPGIGATGTSSGVKWMLNAVANNCTVSGTTSAGTVPYTGVISGAIVKGSGYIVGGNTCPNATNTSQYGASTLKVTWVASPAVGPAFYSTVATSAFVAANMDSLGLTQNRLNTGPTPVSLDLGGDWVAASATQYATDCSGAAPATRLFGFQTPAVGSPHLPAFVATI